MDFGARLKAIGDMVPFGSCIADVGTDHAYLPVLLLQNHRITRAIASDIAVGPCQAARYTVAHFGYQDNVEVRQGDGLKAVRPGETDTIVVAGMGGSTIAAILTTASQTARAAQTLVLQPMNDAAYLRRTLPQYGWCLKAEQLVLEGNRLYEIMALTKGESPVYPSWQYEVGPLLIAGNNSLLRLHLERLIKKYVLLIRSMEKSETAMSGKRYRDFKQLKIELEDYYHENYR